MSDYCQICGKQIFTTAHVCDFTQDKFQGSWHHLPEVSFTGTNECIGDFKTLRDYFAAKASDEDIKEIQSSKPAGYISRQCARFIHADEMIAERNK